MIKVDDYDSKSYKLIFTRHSFKRAHNREIDEDYVRNVIFNEDPLDIDSTRRLMNSGFSILHSSMTTRNLLLSLPSTMVM